MRAYRHNLLMMTMIAAAILVLVAMGCAEDASDDTANGPVTPPAYSIVPYFGDLVSTADNASAAENTSYGPQDTCIIDNYLHAAGQVGFWNTALFVTLAVPVWSFGESFNHSPEQQADGSWVWSYSAHIPAPSGVLHTAELHGEIIDSKVYWEMYITKEGVYDRFLWFSGESDLFATQGTWTLKKSPIEYFDWIGIEWSRSPLAGTWQVKYMNIEEGGLENGGYIHYGITADADYDAFYDLYYKSLDNLVEIEANRATKEGRVINANHFEDGDWYYWDGNHCDVDPL